MLDLNIPVGQDGEAVRASTAQGSAMHNRSCSDSLAGSNGEVSEDSSAWFKRVSVSHIEDLICCARVCGCGAASTKNGSTLGLKFS